MNSMSGLSMRKPEVSRIVEKRSPKWRSENATFRRETVLGPSAEERPKTERKRTLDSVTVRSSKVADSRASPFKEIMVPLPSDSLFENPVNVLF